MFDHVEWSEGGLSGPSQSIVSLKSKPAGFIRSFTFTFGLDRPTWEPTLLGVYQRRQGRFQKTKPDNVFFHNETCPVGLSGCTHARTKAQSIFPAAKLYLHVKFLVQLQLEFSQIYPNGSHTNFHAAFWDFADVRFWRHIDLFLCKEYIQTQSNIFNKSVEKSSHNFKLYFLWLLFMFCI